MASLYFWVALSVNSKWKRDRCWMSVQKEKPLNLQECSSRSREAENDHLLPRDSQPFFFISSPFGRIKKDCAYSFVFPNSAFILGNRKKN